MGIMTLTQQPRDEFKEMRQHLPTLNEAKKKRMKTTIETEEKNKAQMAG